MRMRIRVIDQPNRAMRLDLVDRKRLLPQAWLIGLYLACPAVGQPVVLDPSDFEHYVAEFNSLKGESTEYFISNANAWKWMAANVPLFSCPDRELEEIYYFRWWTYRKHIQETPHGHVITEFLTPVKHAGPYSTISCALGHQIAEGSWLRDRRTLDDYIHFWFRSGPDGGRAQHFHKFSSWAAAAIQARYLVTLDRNFVTDLLDDLVADYSAWETERQRPEGLFWQYDVADGMEESISGSRTRKNIRPTINSYMAASARAISYIAALAHRDDVAARFAAKAEALRSKMAAELWDSEANFYKVRLEDGTFSDAREAIGYIPWMFGLTEPQQSVAWREIKDPAGFFAPRGLTTAERRHPDFRSHGTGTCEWDGAVWPFATSQTLNGLINVLRGPEQPHVTRRDFLSAMQTYALSHRMGGKPYIGEYHDELTGEWLITGPKAARSRDYNHSTYCDLVIRGLAGVIPRDNDIIEVDPLLPPETWDWFCLDGVPYHGQSLTIVWDRTGSRYHRGTGLAVWVDGQEVARRADLGRVTGKMPPAPTK